MTTATPPISRLNNLRDLGGIPVAGGVFSYGRVFRSDDVSTIPADEARELWDRGIRTIIDLRSAEEADHTGRGPLADYDIAYHRLPIRRGGADPDEFLRHLRERSATAATVGDYYASTLAAEASTIVVGLRTIAEGSGGTLFHCAAGKDRTGIFAAALLSVLGASDAEIARDYFRAVAEGRDAVSPLLGAEHEAMLAMLCRLDVAHGGALEVLRGGGLSPQAIAILRERLVEPLA